MPGSPRFRPPRSVPPFFPSCWPCFMFWAPVPFGPPLRSTWALILCASGWPGLGARMPVQPAVEPGSSMGRRLLPASSRLCFLLNHRKPECHAISRRRHSLRSVSGAATKTDLRSGRAGRRAIMGAFVPLPLLLLLFPFFLLARPSFLRWKRRRSPGSSLSVLPRLRSGLRATPLTFGKPAFSQSAWGWLAGLCGLCFTNFDWWDVHDAQAMFDHPVIPKIMGSHCTPDNGLTDLDRQMREASDSGVYSGASLGCRGQRARQGWYAFHQLGADASLHGGPGWIRWSINGVLAFWWWSVTIFEALVARVRPDGVSGVVSSFRSSFFSLRG